MYVSNFRAANYAVLHLYMCLSIKINMQKVLNYKIMKNYLIVTTLLILLSQFSFGQSNPWTSRVEQTLPSYVPLPLNELMGAAMIMSAREAEKTKATIRAYKDLHLETKYFKSAKSGDHNVILILGDKEIANGRVSVLNNRVNALYAGDGKYDTSRGLRSVSEINRAYTKIYIQLDRELIPIEVYFIDLFSDSPVIDSHNQTVNTGELSLNFSGFGLPIVVWNSPNFAKASVIANISPEKEHLVKFTGESSNDFFKINFDGKVGYIYKSSVRVD